MGLDFFRKRAPSVEKPHSSAPSSLRNSEADPEKSMPMETTADGEKQLPTETTKPVGASIAELAVDLDRQPSIAADQHDPEATNEEPQEDEVEYPKAMKLALIMIALCLSVFLMALDNTIISTAIPKITDEFHSISDVGWYASAYLLTTCAFQLFFGKLYSFFSIKWIYLIAIAIFEIGSAVCGAAPNSVALIIGRAVAGLGSAGIFAGAVLILSTVAPLEKRALYMGAVGAMYGIASVVGPLLGGTFTTHLTWRWCFYINLPIGAVTILFIAIFYNPKRRAQALASTWREKVEQFDLLGTVVFLPMIVCLLLALQWGGSKYPWSDGRIIALLVVFAVLVIVFIGIQYWKGDNATVPFRIAGQRSIAAAAWFGATLGAAFFTFVYYIPIWFQAIQGVDAMESGIRNIPLILGLVIISMVAGGLVTAIGYYTPFVIASSVILTIGAGLLTTFEPDTGSPKWIGYQALFGMGIGLGMQQTIIAVQTVLPTKQIPTGTAFIMFSQTLGGALFVSVAQNVFTNSLLKNLKQIVPDLNPEAVISAGATTLSQVVPVQYLVGVRQAYNDAITTTFYVAVAMGAASIIGALSLEWKSIKGKKIEMVAG